MKEIKVDLNTKKTEYEWQKVLDKFWLSATPQWFTWIGWITIMGVLRYLDEHTDNTAIAILNSCSYVFLFMYFLSYFYQIKFINMPLIKNESVARAISLIISGILCYGVFLLLNAAIDELGKVSS